MIQEEYPFVDQSHPLEDRLQEEEHVIWNQRNDRAVDALKERLKPATEADIKSFWQESAGKTTEEILKDLLDDKKASEAKLIESLRNQGDSQETTDSDTSKLNSVTDQCNTEVAKETDNATQTATEVNKSTQTATEVDNTTQTATEIDDQSMPAVTENQLPLLEHETSNNIMDENKSIDNNFILHPDIATVWAHQAPEHSEIAINALDDSVARMWVDENPNNEFSGSQRIQSMDINTEDATHSSTESDAFVLECQANQPSDQSILSPNLPVSILATFLMFHITFVPLQYHLTD